MLGVRAERRASRYEPRWAIKSGNPVLVFNRTGEDASDVNIRVEDGARIHGRYEFDLVSADEPARVTVIPTTRDPGDVVSLVIEWTRHRTGKRYRQPASPNAVWRSVLGLRRRVRNILNSP